MLKNLYKFVVGALFSIILVTPVYAQNICFADPLIKSAGNISSQSIVNQPRGNYISTGFIEISNPGNGEIGVYMQTLTHVEVDETTFGVYLDRWIESEQRWANVANYSFTYNKENSPDDDLMTKAISFNILGQPSDCYYRIRGIHLVTAGDVQEMLSSKTDGILITNTSVE